ncbi:MAG TPA: hypothetical protein VE907_16755 [Gammaproteobacteria bacterium]|nr:hypothetical protein [Gammaproteobacteria bacterium]
MKPHTLVRATLGLALLHGASAYADPPSNSAYVTDPQNSYVEDATSRGIGQVNMITCIMAAMRADALVNEGPYNALVDQQKCDPQSRASTDNAGGGTQASTFVTATVNSTRDSNDVPMRARIWLDDPESDGALIYLNVSASAPPSNANPYGQFRLDYCGRVDSDPSCVFNGFLEGTTSGISYFEREQGGGGDGTKALRMTASSTTSGAGNLSISSGSGNDDAEFSFAYDASYYRRSDGSGEQCFARDAQDPGTGMSVWRYGLYESTTGDRVDRESGFPIEYTHGGETFQGFLGYWGMSLPPAAVETLETGSTVEKVDYGNGDEPTRTAYTVVKAPGKLTKYTRHARTLHGIDQIKFTTFVGFEASSFFSGAQPNTQYELYWDDAAGAFKVTAQMSCGNNGCTTQELAQVETVPASFWAPRGGIQGFSQALGGEVFVDLHAVSGPVDSDAVGVTYRSQDIVYPSDLPSTLFCLRDCATAAAMAAFFAPGSQATSPFAAGTANNFQPTPGGNVVSYLGDAANAVLLDGAAQPVAIPVDAETLGNYPMFMNGIRSGKLFTNLGAAECTLGSGTYCEWKVNNLDVYYQWETGVASYNQFAAVKDADDEFVTFDAPLQVNYHVPAGAAYGQYANQNIVLQYGGFGNLWGIPGICVSHLTNLEVSCDTDNARYVPSFVIPYDSTAGVATADGKTYLVKWLDREIRFARKNLGVCDASGLAVPSSMTLPTAADLKNPSDPASDIYVGVRPAVTDAPRVIHGEQKY